MKVIGIGNILRGDDGIGPAVIEALNEADYDPALFDARELATDSFSVLEEILTREKVLLIDAVDMKQQPGTVKVFDLNDNAPEHVDNLLSLHGMTFSEIFIIARKLGYTEQIKIIGIQPQTLEFGQPLSLPVKNSIDKIINLIMKEVNNDA